MNEFVGRRKLRWKMGKPGNVPVGLARNGGVSVRSGGLEKARYFRESIMIDPRRTKRRRVLWFSVIGMMLLIGGTALIQRSWLCSCYYAQRLRNAGEADRQVWADRLVGMGDTAVPRLLDCLKREDGSLGPMARAGLEKLLANWGPKDPRSARLVNRFFDAHPSFSPAGQRTALQILPEILAATGAESAAKGRTIVSAGLKDRDAAMRVEAIKVARRVDLNLLTAVVPLLDDPEADVRLAAMIALGPLAEGGVSDHPLVSSDELLRWLHDPDPGVRQMCEMSLRSRNLRDRDIRLGRMLVNPNAHDRLKLLLELPDDEDANLLIWLQKLSNDPESAVRAGAARVAAERRVDFADRLDEMSRSDPDGTVRKIAEHYRKWYR